MDVFARGLRNASKIIADGCLDEAKDVSNLVNRLNLPLFFIELFL